MEQVRPRMNNNNGKLFSESRRIVSIRSVPMVSVICAAAFLVGCQDDGHLELAPVTGMVTMDGEPLTQGAVIFTPERGQLAHGEIASDGSFSLSTYGENDGATLGKHQVAIVVLEGEDEFESEVPRKWLIPRRYGAGATSGLTFEVKSGETNEAKFNLSSK